MNVNMLVSYSISGLFLYYFYFLFVCVLQNTRDQTQSLTHSRQELGHWESPLAEKSCISWLSKYFCLYWSLNLWNAKARNLFFTVCCLNPFTNAMAKIWVRHYAYQGSGQRNAISTVSLQFMTRGQHLFSTTSKRLLSCTAHIPVLWLKVLLYSRNSL